MDGPDEFFVTPFDPPLKIKCPCPGDCPGTLQFEKMNITRTLAFLICSECGCAYEAGVTKKET